MEPAVVSAIIAAYVTPDRSSLGFGRAPLLLADATLRYRVDFKTAMPLPGGAASPMPGSGPRVIHVKGDKTLSTQGEFTSIHDLAANQMSYVDAAHIYEIRRRND